MTPEKISIGKSAEANQTPLAFMADISTKLPPPSQKNSGSGKLIFVTIIALGLLGGAAFWLTRDEGTREIWQQQAATAFNNFAQGTPLASLGAFLRDTKPMPPVGESAKNRDAGAAGRAVQGMVTAPLDRSLPPESNTNQNSPSLIVVSPSGNTPSAMSQPQAVPPKVTADTTVRPDFINDLAAYIVSRYKPGSNSGSLNLSVQSLNQHYGTRMTGLVNESQTQGNRIGILRYVFSPAMIQGLYNLYIDRFLEALQKNCEEKTFTLEQTKQLFMTVSGRCVLLAGGMEGVAALQDLSGRLKKLDQVAQNAVNVNSEIMQLVFELDQLREDKSAQRRIDEMQTRVNGLGDRYRKALEERSVAQRLLLSDIRKAGGQSLDDDTLLFLARWVERRMHDTPQALSSVRSAAGILRDLARRCAQSGTISAVGNTLGMHAGRLPR